jgi:hypothetical integral membrane protein (TIGR02206 family)
MRKNLLHFFNYFFGKGDVEEFRYFSLAHLIPILILGVILFLIIKYRDQLAKSPREEKNRVIMSVIMIVAEMSYFWRLLHPDLDANVYDHLPITICGIANVICAFMLLTKSKKCFDIVYFLVLGTSINAIITPAVLTYCGPTRYRYYQYWTEHMMLFISVFYMMFVHKMRPTWKSYIPSVAVLVSIGLLAVFANWLLGSGYTPDNHYTTANYLFINAVEDGFSIANFLPSNPWLKWLCIFGIVSVLYLLPYIPWIIIDNRKKKQSPAKQTAE